MQGPHADYACLSKKCLHDGASTVYDLPVGATHCPICGSKRIQRLYNAVNVSSGIANKVDAVVEPAYNGAMAVRDEARTARRDGRVVPALGVPIGNLGAALGKIHPAFQSASLPSGGGRPLPTPPTIVGQQLRSHPPRPTFVAGSDKEYRIGVRRDGAGKFAGATVERA